MPPGFVTSIVVSPPYYICIAYCVSKKFRDIALRWSAAHRQSIFYRHIAPLEQRAQSFRLSFSTPCSMRLYIRFGATSSHQRRDMSSVGNLFSIDILLRWSKETDFRPSCFQHLENVFISCFGATSSRQRRDISIENGISTLPHSGRVLCL